MKSFLPIFENFQATSIFKAFVINGIVAALIATLTIEVRVKLENEKSGTYIFSQKLFNREKLSEFHKILVVFGISFIISFVTYHIMLILFSYGGGMIVTKVFNKMNWINYFDDIV